MQWDYKIKEMKSDNSIYTGFQFEVENFRALAIINADLKKMDDRFQYAHSVFIDVLPETYEENGYPTEQEHDVLVEIEKKLISYLENHTETLHVGHTTLYRKREIIFYTKEPQKVDGFLDYFLSTIERESNYEIEEDRNWDNVAAFYELIE